jgi:hypothetical protein
MAEGAESLDRETEAKELGPAGTVGREPWFALAAALGENFAAHPLEPFAR